MGKAPKREQFLKKKLYSKNFVLAYDFGKTYYGVFFGISGKSASTVVRNRIKRVFREKIRKEILPVLEKKNICDYSICLISKKGVVINDRCAKGSLSSSEIEELVDRLYREV